MGTRDFCFLLKPRHGCMIIAIIEIYWYFKILMSSLNLYMAMGVLLTIRQIIQEIFYNHTPVDLVFLAWIIKEAAIGIGIFVAASVCSLLLFVATLWGKRHLIFVYSLKNVFVVALGIYHLVQLGLEYRNDMRSFVDKELRMVINVFFEMLIVPIYFTIIAMFYYKEETCTTQVETEREEI